MKIIVLQGKSHSGKATSLGFVYDLIGGEQKDKVYLGGDRKDFKAIVNYKNFKIAFFSMSENSNELRKAIYRYNDLGCDLLICSLSTSKAHVRANKALNDPKFKCTRIEKSIVITQTEKEPINRVDAQKIFALI